jgi:hypothetical protein
MDERRRKMWERGFFRFEDWIKSSYAGSMPEPDLVRTGTISGKPFANYTWLVGPGYVVQVHFHGQNLSGVAYQEIGSETPTWIVRRTPGLTKAEFLALARERQLAIGQPLGDIPSIALDLFLDYDVKSPADPFYDYVYRDQLPRGVDEVLRRHGG